MTGMIDKPTPMSTDTRAALNAIRRRVGNHGAFREAMIRGMRSRHRPGLQEIQTQAGDDWTIAFLDAWAVALDGLSFYNERIVNEAFLETATETFSVQELAALVGYTLSPAVAAEAWMAFTADESVLDKDVIELEAGLQIKSIPEEGELPQTFETVEPLRLKSRWNLLHPVVLWPQDLTQDHGGFYVDPTQQALRVGDRLAFLDAAGVPKRADPVAPSTKRQILRPISLVETLSDQLAWIETAPDTPPEPMPTIADLSLPEAGDLDTLAPATISALKTDLEQMQWLRADVLEAASGLEVATSDLAQTLAATPRVKEGLTPVIFREKCRFFGHNAVSRPQIKSGADTSLMIYEDPAIPSPWILDRQSNAITDDDIREAEAPEGRGADRMISIFLDRKYDSIVPGSLVVIRGKRHARISRRNRRVTDVQERWLVVDDVETASIEAYGTSGEVTKLRVPAIWHGRRISDIFVRSAELFVASEPVALPDLPVPDVVSGSELLLDEPDLDFASGQSVIVTGERADMPGVTASERLELDEVWVNGTTQRLTFQTPMTLSYVRDTVTLTGNVARATHGEAAAEILGSGDGRAQFQRFKLKGMPLTYVSADTPNGRKAELEVRVDGVRWAEVPALDEAGPEDRVYTVTTREDGSSEIMFGGAGMGARLPTGENNVEALYRKGAGAEGRLKAGQLTLLVSKPRSLKAVTNPLPAAGGAAAERLEDARQNAPKGMLTLGRVVSLRDYETFATGFAGVTKAKAAWSWVSEDQHVFLTVAGEDEAPLLTTDSVVTNLTKAILDYSAPGTGVTIRPARVANFTLKAHLLIDPDYRASDGSAEPVITEARVALRAAFAFPLRAIGQPVRASDIIALLQSVPGVKAVDLDLLHRTDRPIERLDILRADVPRTGNHGSLLGAEILLLGADPVQLEAI